MKIGKRVAVRRKIKRNTMRKEGFSKQSGFYLVRGKGLKLKPPNENLKDWFFTLIICLGNED